ncbi:MAG: SDR family oxidoreductase, partial [Pseudomonadota bacterium]
SKAAAEVKIQEAVEQGFPATVHRPSMVVGDSNSGAVVHFQIFYFICDFLSGKRTMGLYPKLGQATLDVVPNDFVAKAVVAAAEDASTAGDIFHLCSGPDAALRLFELREIVRSKFKQAGKTGWLPKIDLSRENFSRVLNAVARFLSERDRRAIGTLPIYLDYLTGIQQFGNTESLRKLGERGVTPSDNAKVVENALNYYFEQKK